MPLLLIGEFQSFDLSVAAILEDLRANHPAGTLRLAGPVSHVFRRMFPTLPVVESPFADSFERILIVGAFSSPGRWQEAFRKANFSGGPAIELHNLSLPFHSDLMTLSSICSDMSRIKAITVRDHRTAELVLHWPIMDTPRLLAYPERAIEADFSLAGRLRHTDVVGLSFRNTDAMIKALEQSGDVLAAVLDPFSGAWILPLPASVDGASSHNDIAGISSVIHRFLPTAQIAMPELLDHAFIDRHLTPARLKGLVSTCRIIVSQRELPVVFAAAYSKMVIAIAATAETSALRAMSTLANDLLPTSQAIRL